MAKLPETPGLRVKHTFIEYAGGCQENVVPNGLRRSSSDSCLVDVFELKKPLLPQDQLEELRFGQSETSWDEPEWEQPPSSSNSPNDPSSVPIQGPSDCNCIKGAAATPLGHPAAEPGVSQVPLAQLAMENWCLSEQNRLLRERAQLLSENTQLLSGNRWQSSPWSMRESGNMPCGQAAVVILPGRQCEQPQLLLGPPPQWDDQGAAQKGSAPWGAAGRKEHTGDLPTTVMLRNLPNNYTRAMIMTMLDGAGFAGLYDFVYLPIDFTSHAALGYAFVNLVSPKIALAFWDHFDGYSDWVLPTKKVCKVGWSVPHQGLKAHVQRYRNSPLMHESVPDQYKPIVFRGGERVPFPKPTVAASALKVPIHRVGRSRQED